MLHAILHGKLEPLTPDAQRLEDAITSTVFGTLAMVARWDILHRWLTGTSSDKVEVTTGDMWFWPTLRTTRCTSIPDVCVRVENLFLLIEAKYTSGRSDVAALEESPEQVRDQLVRQHMCLSASANDRIGYAEDISGALNACDSRQVFLVDARRIRRARAELRASQLLEPDMTIALVTWQQLDRLLYERCNSERWARDLRRFLEIEGLGAFIGFHQALRSVRTLRGIPWREGAEAGHRRRWSHITPTLLSRARVVDNWRGAQTQRGSDGRD